MVRDRASPQLPGKHLGRVAVVVRRRLPRVRLVVGAGARRRPGSGCAGRSRVTCAPASVAQRHRDRLEDAVDLGERVDVGADAALAAERVVDAGVAEVVEPAGEVDGVRPRVGELGDRLARARRRVAGNAPSRSLPLACDRRRRDVAQRDLAARSARRGRCRRRRWRTSRERSRSVGPRVAGERAQLGEEAAQLRRDRLGLADERAQVVDRGAQVDERRVRAAHERRQLADRVGQRVLLAADRAGDVGEVVDQAGEVLARSARSVTSLRRGDDEAARARACRR